MMINRTSVTKELSHLVEKRLKGQHKFWASEVTLDKHSSETRVDYLAFDPCYSHGGMLVPASIERGAFTCYEVKSCLADFKSGCGLNFYGDKNYLVCTKELAEEIRGAVLSMNIDAVLVPDASYNKLYIYITKLKQVELYERRQQGNYCGQ